MEPETDAGMGVPQALEVLMAPATEKAVDTDSGTDMVPMNKLVCSTGTALANPADYRKKSWIRERLWRIGVRKFFPVKLLGVHTDIEKEVERGMTSPSIYRGSFVVNTRIGNVLVYLRTFAPEGSEGCYVYLLLEGSRSQYTSFFSSRELPLAYALCEYINKPKEDQHRGKILRPVEADYVEADVNKNTYGLPIDVVTSSEPRISPAEVAVLEAKRYAREAAKATLAEMEAAPQHKRTHSEMRSRIDLFNPNPIIPKRNIDN